MIVVSNRVQIPESRAETFVERLRESHGIEAQPGFVELRLLEPVDAEGYVTMTVWESLEDYRNWRDGDRFERAHDGRDAEETFAAPNEVEIHEVAVERSPERE
ncbi:MAG: antibiotic biosynthesis monooxygenase [Haloferacaceae archaeon]